MRRVLAIGVAALWMSIGCGGKEGDVEKHAAPAHATADSVLRLGPWAGTLPCADCSGIRTELTLFAGHPQGEPRLYHLRQTYLGTPDGERAFTTLGRWRPAPPPANAPHAIVYELAFDKPGEERWFHATGDGALRELDRLGSEIASNAPHTLQRDDRVAAPAFVSLGRPAAAVVLRPGEDMLVRLPANRTTGFQWALADSARDVVAAQGTLYVQDAITGLAVGVGGNEYWRLAAARRGERTLRFVYQRPWEQQAPVRAAELRVTVR
jgi:predicted secreted protein/uncharacterized lipoprotein NlpE involved in copper resistance